jgi:uncharacterized protein (DUF2461 family)
MDARQSRSHVEGDVTDPAFGGFGTAAFEWFAGLERDNSREYFTATRQRYEADVRGPLTLMLRELSGSFGGAARVFRQQNDMRLSPTFPYKTRTYGVLDFVSPVRARLYADLSTRGLYAGTGYQRLASDQMHRYRDAVVDAHLGALLGEAFATVQQAGLERVDDSVTAAPRGYPRDHPREQLLRFRSVLVGRLMSGESDISRDDALDHVGGTWRAAAPLTAWLDEHVGPSTLAPRERWPRRPAKSTEPPV